MLAWNVWGINKPGMTTSMSKKNDAGAMICLSEVVDLLKTEGLANAGKSEGLLAYQALSRIKSNAVAFDVPLSEIGLADFDVDALLKA
ncbi:MAG: hypothetical protein PHT19_11050 [Methylococcus sp.]|nr:hypothetical protein [Methylococcus sp.]